ncbi:MAG: GIY-YIG nuclease family protein [Candidatus Daviesbacteria bacterium]|nr:GIY-YIG nuclease family protein [Candidatus Daviesbacteria bacterium]
MFYVYILLSEQDNKFYIGFTKDLRKRLKQHNNKQVISTSKRGKLALVMYEAYMVEDDAREREKFFKTTKGKMQLRKQLAHFLSTRV